MARKPNDHGVQTKILIEAIDAKLGLLPLRNPTSEQEIERTQQRIQWLTSSLQKGETWARNLLSGMLIGRKDFEELCVQLGIPGDRLSNKPREEIESKVHPPMQPAVKEALAQPSPERSLDFAAQLATRLCTDHDHDGTLYFSGDDCAWLETLFRESARMNSSEVHSTLSIRRVVLRLMPDKVVKTLISSGLVRDDLLENRKSNLLKLHRQLNTHNEHSSSRIEVLPEEWKGFPQYWGALLGEFLVVGQPRIDPRGHFSLETNPQRIEPHDARFKGIAALLRGNAPAGSSRG